MNLLLIEREELAADGRVTLSGRRARHLRQVLDVQVGQVLRAGIVRGPLAMARVTAVGDGVELDVELGESPELPRTDLVLAVPRPKALSRIVQAVASMGVRRIDIVNAWRVDASYFSSPKLELLALEQEARLGCEQGRQTYLPVIEVHRYFVPYVEGVLGPRMQAERTHRLIVAHPGAARGIESVLPPGSRQPIVLAIGPDGGFLEREVGSLAAIGGQVAHFGQAVLRSEVAVVSLLSQLDLLRRLAPPRAEPA